MEELYFCGNLGETMTIEAQNVLPHVKRFMECMQGIPDFYKAVDTRNEMAVEMMLAEYDIQGISIKNAFGIMDQFHDKNISILDVAETELIDYPEFHAWTRWSKALKISREAYMNAPFESKSPAFNEWRNRQIKRCHSQLPKLSAQALIHAPVAFELSDGCSRNCPFCGLASEPLRGTFNYTAENRKLWRETLKTLQNHLGDVVGRGPCYWATEPSDNPYYLSFLEDFGEITGEYPQTTTAVGAYRITFIKALLDFRAKHRTAAERFSVLSELELKRILKTYSAEELMYVELILQYSEGRQKGMAFSGRNVKAENEPNPKNTSQAVEDDNDHLEDHTIACVSGYLVNMVNQTIKLITPCPPSEKYPLGYITKAETHWKDIKALDAFVEMTLETVMSKSYEDDLKVSFREDLTYTPVDNGFELKAKYKVYRFKGEGYLEILGQMIASDSQSIKEITNLLLNKNYNLFQIIGAIDQLKRECLLEVK